MVCEQKYNAMNFEELRSTAGPAVCSFWDFRICQNDLVFLSIKKQQFWDFRICQNDRKKLQEVRTQG